MIDPKVALISVGKNNRYRHPSYLTLKRLEAYGVKIYRSDLQGMVKIVYYGGKNYVMTSSGFKFIIAMVMICYMYYMEQKDY